MSDADANPVIRFEARADVRGRVPEPYPARNAIPDWFRNMPMEAVTPGFSTVKRCPPFLDAMSFIDRPRSSCYAPES